jgi:outer membrane protein assembly factor BamB
MIPVRWKLDPALARFFASTLRGIVVIGAVFCVAVAAVLVAGALQLSAVKPLDDPALAALRERYHQDQDNESLAEQIRVLDLAARRLYFTREWQIRTGAWMLVAGAAITLASLRGAGALTRTLPRTRPQQEEPPMAGRSIRIALSILVLALLVSGLTAAALSGVTAGRVLDMSVSAELKANWPQFRGPGGLGIAEGQDPPVGGGVAWTAEVPLPGRGSPIVWGNHVYLSGATKDQRMAFCWDTRTGTLLWSVDIPLAEGSDPKASRQPDTQTGWAASSMAANRAGVFVAFATGDLTALSHDGEILWSRHVGTPGKMGYGYAASPAVTADAVIVQFDGPTGGELTVLDARSGKVAWQASRTVESSWSSPVVVREAGRWIVLAQGNPFLAAYDAVSGAELWTGGEMAGDVAPSPAWTTGLVFAADQMLALTALNADSGTVAWQAYEDFPTVASPLAAGDMLLYAASYGTVTCANAATGDVFWKDEIGADVYASPIAAGGRFYLVDMKGTVRVYAAAHEKKLLGTISLGEKVEATPAVHDNALFLRSEKHLLRIGGTGATK